MLTVVLVVMMPELEPELVHKETGQIPEDSLHIELINNLYISIILYFILKKTL